MTSQTLGRVVESARHGSSSGANYGIGGFTVGLIAHFVGSFHECGTGGKYIGGSLCYQDPTDKRRVGSFHSEDITVQYSLFTQFGKTTIGAGVNNVLDHEIGRASCRERV